MFTGLVESLGSVRDVSTDGAGTLLRIEDATIANELPLGASVAVNGVCLTAIAADAQTFSFQAGPETLKLTNLGELRPGMKVNLERALRLGDRLGGHIVQGHVDGIGKIDKRERLADWETVWFTCSPDMTRQMIRKGSITIDGVSLTLVDVADGRFSVALIPHTLAWYNTHMNETHPAPRQTQSYLRELFQCNSLHPKNKLGQNFLIDLNLVDFIVNAAELTRADLALEIGSGTGSLTAKLAERAGSVLSVEIDPAFHALAEETVHGHANVRILNADVLKNKNLLNPDVLTALYEMREKYQPQRLKLVANLPYAVATPVISNFLIAGVELERIVVTVQWEIAEKLIAQPSTKEYGALAVLVQALADVELLRKMPPSVFWPRPQVESGIVRILPSAAKRAQIADVQRFRNFLRDLYSHRRKNLRGGIIAMTGHQHEKAIVDKKLAELGYAGTERAETLSIAQHQELCEAFSEPEA